MTQTLLAIENLSVGFRHQQTVRTVVNDVSLQIAAGETLALVGDAPRDKCTLSCAINGIHAAFHYLKKNYISGCVMTVPTG